MFINDLYNEQRIVKDGVFPLGVLDGSKQLSCRSASGMTPRFGVWAHICGTDLVRDGDGTVYVLEDNLRVPSGVSYMLENRQLMKRLFPELFQASASSCRSTTTRCACTTHWRRSRRAPARGP
jgi:uncharacterized circularly permuted ATP-grasp superfamily protein